ncbi:MAG: hypothetical protein M3373_14795 [Gemmatimonadota bacterium]|nr:hypothetical protein [Gemmatimonadota bacterium]
MNAVGDARERRETVARLLAAESIDRSTRNYEGAWRLVDSAAGADGRSPVVRRAREALAMQWLRNARGSDDQDLASLARRLQNVVSTGAAEATGTYRADLLAHIGWANFLIDRYGALDLDRRAALDSALAIDSANVYAHSMHGFLAAWRPADIPRARSHFTRALASGRERPYVRDLQVTAYINARSAESWANLLRVADEMRREGAELGPGGVAELRTIYHSGLFSSDERDSVVHAIPPAAHVALIQWVFADELARRGAYYDELTLALAIFEERAGRPDQALAAYRELVARDSLPPRRQLIRDGVQRLSGVRLATPR